MLSKVFEFAGVEDFGEAGGCGSALEILREFGYFLLEVINGAKAFTLNAARKQPSL